MSEADEQDEWPQKANLGKHEGQQRTPFPSIQALACTTQVQPDKRSESSRQVRPSRNNPRHVAPFPEQPPIL